MRTVFFAATAFSAILTVLAAPTVNVPITKRAGPVEPNPYTTMLKPGISKYSHIAKLLSNKSNSSIMYKSSDVESIHKDGISKVPAEYNVSMTKPVVQPVSHLSKHNSVGRWETRSCSWISCWWRPTSTIPDHGHGVDIYILDSGINTGHTCFGERARWAQRKINQDTDPDIYVEHDGNGGGTCAASIAGGTGFGLATGANLIAVKVIPDRDNFHTTDAKRAIEDVISAAKRTHRPSIIVYSIRGEMGIGAPGGPIESAVKKAIRKGIHFTLAAADYERNAADMVSVRIPEAITVGAVDSQNRRSRSGRYNRSVDVWAPGIDVWCAGITSTSATRRVSGASYAAPYVAGILAVAISKYGNKSPAELSAKLKAEALHVVKLPDGTDLPEGTTNRLAIPWWVNH